MHLNDFSLGYFGSNGIVGASLGIAMGAALAAKLSGSAAGLRRLLRGGWREHRQDLGSGELRRQPEAAADRGLREQPVRRRDLHRPRAHRPVDRRTRGRLRAAGRTGRRPGRRAPFSARRSRRASALRSGGGPTFIEAVTYRYNGHNTGETAGYRTDEEVEEWRRVRDPIDALRRAMEAGGLLDGDRYERSGREGAHDRGRLDRLLRDVHRYPTRRPRRTA